MVLQTEIYVKTFIINIKLIKYFLYYKIIFHNIMNVDNLPSDVINIIKKFLPKNLLFYTSKDNFERYYINFRLLNTSDLSKKNTILNIENDYFIRKNYLLYLKSNNISKNRYLNMLIRKDYDYILKTIINTKYNHWKKIKNYYYKGNRYPTYIIFLENLCIKYNSNKCRLVINDVSKEDSKLRKKRYKKIKTITNRWKN